MNKEEIRKYWQFEIPSTNLFVVEENYDNQPILKFGEYLNDMQCRDTDTKLYIEDLKYVKQLQQENKQLKDNWNKLKEYCEKNLYFYTGMQNEDLETDTSIENVLEKMQELDKGDNNE